MFARFSLACVLCMLVATSAAVLSPHEALSQLGEFAPTERNLDSGCRLLGRTYGTAEAFLGIPYAQAPVGNLRWQPPVMAECTGTFDATHLGPACPQNMESELQGQWEAEDCLFLNVWTPPVTTNSSAPVMVYMHGGGWNEGSGSLALYFGKAIAEQGVVLVTFNYRLGALGFLTTPDISGNYGFLDQRMVLEWVQKKIHHFGGDANAVTIVGQSAGGISVSTHLTAPLSFGLFHQAIDHSGPAVITYRTQEESYGYGEQLADALGCDVSDVDCLMNASWEDILSATQEVKPVINDFPIPLDDFFAFMPVLDGENILVGPLDAINANAVAPGVNTVWGTTKNETAGWVFESVPNLPLVPLEYSALVIAIFGERDARKIEKQYPVDDSDDVRYQLTALTVDYGFTCALRHNALALAKNNTSSGTVRRYAFLHAPSSDPRATATVSHCADIDQSCHGAELDYIFQTAKVAGASFTDEEKSLSEQMSAIWVSLVKGEVDETLWPTFSSNDANVLAIDLPSPYLLDGYQEDACDFWENLGVYNT